MLKSCKMAKYSEDELLWRHILTRFNKGISQYGLIDDGDNIMVALSGGKDSMALLSLLAEKSRIFKPRFSVVAVHVVMQNVGYKSDIDYLRDFSASLGVPFFHVETSYEYSEQSGKPHCFLCSWNRRKVLFSCVDYCNLNVTGKVYLTFTVVPFCLPGVQLGMAFTTRTASLSNDGSTPRTTFTLDIEPVLLTTN